MRISVSTRSVLALLLAVCAVFAGGATRIVQDQCGPFTDVTPAFCPYILELYYLGITAGTSATTFSPDDPLTRGQAAVFVAKGLNQSLARSSPRAALGQWWTTQSTGLTAIPLGFPPERLASDGADIWVASQQSPGIVARFRASDGRLLGTWSGGGGNWILVAMGRIFTVDSSPSQGSLFMIDPTQPPGLPTPVTTQLGAGPTGIAFDGSRIWTSNLQSVSIVTPGAAIPWAVTTVSGEFSVLDGIVFDGANMWVADVGNDALLKFDASGSVVQSVPTGAGANNPAFDGANIWVPNQTASTVTVVHAATGSVLATLTGNGLSRPFAAAFDGQRLIVTNLDGSVSLWRAADLTPLGSVSMGADSGPVGVCSDGIQFWIALLDASQLVRL